jgi:two-component system, NarL family, invasion response regulator UvrY
MADWNSAPHHAVQQSAPHHAVKQKRAVCRERYALGTDAMRILIVDDHPIVASGCRTVLADEPEIAIFEASDAESAERAFIAEQPDICVVDINLPTVSGFELARRLLARDGTARIIMFSMNDDPVFVARAIEIGAKGYVSKTGDPHDLVEAIREVGKGGVYLPSALARSIAFAGPDVAKSPLSKLNSREMEILRLLSSGKSLSEIAWLVHSPYKTVANTSSIIRQKLGVRTSAELVRLAIESGVAR